MIKECDVSKGICECSGLVSTTYYYRDISLSDGSGSVNDILCSCCDSCGVVLAIPPQEIYKIKLVCKS